MAILTNFDGWKEEEAKANFLQIAKQIGDCLGVKAEVNPDESCSTFNAVVNYKKNCKIEIITSLSRADSKWNCSIQIQNNPQ